MKGISLSYYISLFDKELSIAQAKLDVTTSFWCDEVMPHMMLCHSILLVLNTFRNSSDRSKCVHCFSRYEDLKLLYEQKRHLWATIDNSRDILDDLPF